MYEKRLNGNLALYFRYAPPMTQLDQASVDRPNPPFRGAPREQCSVYYYWWAFLRENEGYMACCENKGQGEFARLYEDFGDVRGEDFMWWWKRGGRKLFCEPMTESVKELRDAPKEWDKEKELLILAPITADFERSIEEFRGLLREARVKRRVQMQKRDMQSDEFSRAQYPVHTRPVLTSLHQTLTIWKLKKQLGAKGTLVNVGKHAAELLDRERGGKGNDVDPIPTTTVSNCLKAAKNLIRNVGEGRFPDFTDALEDTEKAEKSKTGEAQPRSVASHQVRRRNRAKIDR